MKYTALNSLDLISFMKEGDKFLLLAKNSASSIIVRSGVADHDGHAVSKNYGWINGSHYYDDPDKNYINVKFYDGVYNSRKPNDSIYQVPSVHGVWAKGMSDYGKNAEYTLWLETEAYNRVLGDCVKTPEEIHPELKETAEQKRRRGEIAQIEQQMRALADRLSKIKEEQ